jgi:hypothetical protein
MTKTKMSLSAAQKNASPINTATMTIIAMMAYHAATAFAGKDNTAITIIALMALHVAISYAKSLNTVIHRIIPAKTGYHAVT